MLPKPLDGSHFSEGWREYEDNEEREGWYKGDGYEDMHLQGRRWAGNIKDKFNVAKGIEYKGSIYDAGPTFESYDVPHGSSGTFCMGIFFFFLGGFDWVVGKWGVFDLFGSWLSNVKWVYSVFDLKMSVCEELLLRNGFWVLKTLV